MNVYAMLADLISVVHIVYIGCVLFGQLAIMIGWVLGWQWVRNPWFRFIHLAMVVFVAFEAMIDYECPLTTWEWDLRVLAGQRGVDDPVSDGFIAELIARLMKFDEKWESVLHASYYIVAGVVLATFFLGPPRFRRKPAPLPAPEPIPDSPTISESATAIIPPAATKPPSV